MTYFCPDLDPRLGESGRKTTILVRDHEYHTLTKFHQNPSSGSGKEVENMKSLGTDDDGQCTMTIAHICACEIHIILDPSLKVALFLQYSFILL